MIEYSNVHKPRFRVFVVIVGLGLIVVSATFIGRGSFTYLVTEPNRFQVLPLPFWLIGLVGLLVLKRHIKPDWLAPINVVVIMWVWIFFVAPLIQVAIDDFHFPYSSDPNHYLRQTGWLAFLGFIAFLIGYNLPVRGIVSDVTGRVADVLNYPSRLRLDALIIVTYAVGILVLLYRYMRGGGITWILENRQAVSGGSWWMTPGILLATVACLLAYCYWGQKRKLFPVLLTLSMLLIVFGLRAITGRRAWALEPVIMVLFAARYLEQKIRPNLFMALITAAGLLGVLLWLGDYRTSGGFSQQAAQTGSWLPRILHETSRVEKVMWVIEFIPAVKPHQWGLGFLGQAFPLFFGRIFAWHEITWFHTGQVTTLARGLGAFRAGAASTPIGPLYHEFSVVGVGAGFFLFGRLLKVLYTELVQKRGTPAAIALYTPFLFFAWLYTIGGSWQALYHLQMETIFTISLLYLARPKWIRYAPQMKLNAKVPEFNQSYVIE